MKTANLVIAIIYSIIILLLMVSFGMKGDMTGMVGGVIFFVPVAFNWLSYLLWPKQTAQVVASAPIISTVPHSTS